MTTPPLTGDRLVQRVNNHAPGAKPASVSPHYSPDEVAEIVAAYQGGASFRVIARTRHHDAGYIKRAVIEAGVTLRTQVESLASASVQRAQRQDGVCRACGILLAKAGCGHHDGVCCECWATAAGMVRQWGLGIVAALERWIEEGRQAEGDGAVDTWIANILERKNA